MLDPNIILAASANHPQFQSPLDTFQKALGLRELMNRAQSQQLAVQEQQQQYNDQQSLRSLFQQNANPTAEQIYGAAGPQMGTAVLGSINDLKAKQAALLKSQQDNALQAADYMGRGASIVQKANYDPDVAISVLQTAKGTPFEAQATGYAQQIAQNKNPAFVQQVFDNIAAHAESLKDQHVDQAAAQQAAARQQIANADTLKALTEKASADKVNGQRDLNLVGQLFGGAQNQNDWQAAFDKAKFAGVSPALLGTLPTVFNPSTAATVARQALTPDQSATLSQGQQRNNIAAGELSERQRHDQASERQAQQAILGSQWTSPGDIPPAQAAYVDRVYNGKDTAPGPNSKQRPAFNTAMSILHPDYDMITGLKRAAGAKDIASGQRATNEIALNTQVGHISEALGAIDQMGNGDIMAINKAAQYWGRQTGHSNVTDFDTFKSAVGSETAKALGDLSEPERQAWQEKISNAASPTILRGVLTDLARVAAQRGAAQQDHVIRVDGIKDYQVYSPQNRMWLQKHGIDPDTGGGYQQPGASANRKPLSAIFK